MTDRDSQSICGIGLRKIGKFQNGSDHMLHLLFGGGTGSRYSLLDQTGRILTDRQTHISRSNNSHPARLPQLKGRVSIFRHKHLFNGELGWLILSDNLRNSGINLL